MFLVVPLKLSGSMRIHHECPCRIVKSHPRGRTFNQERGLPVEIPAPRVRFPYPAWISSMDSFSPTFKWIVPRTNGPEAWSYEIEVSHMGKKLISYGQWW